MISASSRQHFPDDVILPTCSQSSVSIEEVPRPDADSKCSRFSGDLSDVTSVGVQQHSIQTGLGVSSLPFYAVEAPVDIPDSLRDEAPSLDRSQFLYHPHHGELASGLERIQLAYDAGRQAAMVLRGEDTRQGHVAYSSVRSPSFFVVLRGLQGADIYPCSFSNFTEYKVHVYADLYIPRPRCLHTNSVSESFYSKSEARAYCLGAGLPGLIPPKNSASKTPSRSKRKRSSDVIDSKRECSKAMSAPRGRVFMKAVRDIFVTATADGEKFFECSRRKNIFKNMNAGDLLLLVQTKSQQRVVAVGEVAHPATRAERNRTVLYDLLPERLHAALNLYLRGVAVFDYVQFNKVYDLRSLNLKAKDVLGYGDFDLDPRKNFGMGVLDAVETTESSIEKLRVFLQAQTTQRAMSSVDGADEHGYKVRHAGKSHSQDDDPLTAAVTSGDPQTVSVPHKEDGCVGPKANNRAVNEHMVS